MRPAKTLAFFTRDAISSSSEGRRLSSPRPAHTSFLSDEQCQESCAKYLGEMRNIMFGEDESQADPALQVSLVSETHRAGLLGDLVTLVPKLFFETRKDAAAVFNGMVRHPIGNDNRLPLVDYLDENPRHLLTILGSPRWGRSVPPSARAVNTRGDPKSSMMKLAQETVQWAWGNEFLRMFDYVQLPSQLDCSLSTAASFGRF